MNQPIFSEIHYKQEIYCEEFPLMHSQNFLQPNTSCKIMFMFILKKVRKKVTGN
jgi:hypothetical protein